MHCWLLGGLAQPNEQILNCLLLAGMDSRCGYVLICSAFLSLLSDMVGKAGGTLLFPGVGL